MMYRMLYRLTNEVGGNNELLNKARATFDQHNGHLVALASSGQSDEQCMLWRRDYGSDPVKKLLAETAQPTAKGHGTLHKSYFASFF